jgi:inosine-uridine nucleoside N-ribohydrolase
MDRVKIVLEAHFWRFVLLIVVFGVSVLFLTSLNSCVVSDDSPGQEPLHRLKEQGKCKKIPVVFDTDIGSDIDDTWALCMLLKSPELDIKLITTALGDTSAKARIVTKLLEVAGMDNIPVGIGLAHKDMGPGHRQMEWVRDYELSSYPGTIYEDGVQALIDTIMDSPKPIVVIAVGPLPNIAAALKREPRIAEKARFVGMQGSIRRGYEGNSTPHAEWNAKMYPEATQTVFTAPWEMTITPLDTCGIVHLDGKKYQKVLQSKSPLARALIENYRAWAKSQKIEEDKVDRGSTTLYDTVAIYLAMSTELVEIERLGIRVTDDGHTVIDSNAKKINCAMAWKDLGAFEDFLVSRLVD